ncbi:hypothetical protein B0I35DRAFT_480273 [Stachybotrys elegans]|uniref:2EXR domain-containing protein n=1 Tax=Stachybotrys elegans TaxID=80388 RepID=A0A8K0SNH7_9HYPO|nr:hypothetical protein B0I35DRAFT_480273 [Stachybotrys elegans]
MQEHFPQFPRLPLELRQQIWLDAIAASYEESPVLFPYKKGCWCPLGQDPSYEELIIFEFCDNLLDPVQVDAALAWVNHEAREVAMRWAHQRGLKMRGQDKSDPRSRKSSLPATPLLTRPYISSRDTLYVAAHQLDDFLREPYSRASAPDMRNTSYSATSHLRSLAIPEALFWRRGQDLGDVFDWHLSVASFLVIVEPCLELQFGSPEATTTQPLWQLEDTDTDDGSGKAKFVWNRERALFELVGRVGRDEHDVFNEDLYARMADVLGALAMGLAVQGVERLEICPMEEAFLLLIFRVLGLHIYLFVEEILSNLTMFARIAVSRLVRPAWTIARAQQPRTLAAAAAAPSRRTFASESNPSMAELANRMQNDPQMRDMVEKLAKHPGAVAAMSKLGELLKTKGVDPGSSPSRMQLVKLMMDSEVREAAVKLNEEMRAAGIDMDPNVFLQMMKEK